MKQILKQFSQQLGIYKELRYSSAYYALLKYTDRVYFQDLDRDLQFYLKSLPTSCKLIFDVGANHGDKTMIFRQMAEKVVCVEPDESSFEALSIRYGTDPKVELENIALAAEPGELTFFVADSGAAYNTLSEKQKQELVSLPGQQLSREVVVSVSTLDHLIKKYGIPDFIKIDVEGYEKQVLQGLTSRVSLISFEANLPLFLDETLAIMQGFCRQNPSVKFNLMNVSKHDFVFPSMEDYESVIPILMRKEKVTYDVFVYN